jgi:hypothetical protein
MVPSWDDPKTPEFSEQTSPWAQQPTACAHSQGTPYKRRLGGRPTTHGERSELATAGAQELWGEQEAPKGSS